jgi:hypothetical protein
MGGKEDARRNIPAPFNNELMEALVRVSVQLLQDPAFCNAKVGARCLAHVPREHRAQKLMPYHRRFDGVPPLVARELMAVVAAQVLVPLFGACASLSAACLSAVWVTPTFAPVADTVHGIPCLPRDARSRARLTSMSSRC